MPASCFFSLSVPPSISGDCHVTAVTDWVSGEVGNDDLFTLVHSPPSAVTRRDLIEEQVKVAVAVAAGPPAVVIETRNPVADKREEDREEKADEKEEEEEEEEKGSTAGAEAEEESQTENKPEEEEKTNAEETTPVVIATETSITVATEEPQEEADPAAETPPDAASGDTPRESEVDQNQSEHETALPAEPANQNEDAAVPVDPEPVKQNGEEVTGPEPVKQNGEDTAAAPAEAQPTKENEEVNASGAEPPLELSAAANGIALYLCHCTTTSTTPGRGVQPSLPLPTCTSSPWTNPVNPPVEHSDERLTKHQHVLFLGFF